MTAILRNIADVYTDIMDNRSDPRVKGWLLMSGPMPTVVICLGYAFVVKYLGPKLMEKRKPFELKKTLIVYNFLQVLFSIWIFRESIIAGWFNGYSFRCQPVDYSWSPHALRVVRGCWWYYFSKFTEFLDTIFFVLRKKNSHISKLHVIHHGIMPLSTWFGVKFIPGGHSTFFGMINTFVHIVMYTYYMLAAFGPSMQKYLWWKKYLTTFQMVQFVLVLLHSSQLLFIECDYPRGFVLFIMMHAVLFFFLFKEFYEMEYKNKQRKAPQAIKLAGGSNGIVKKNGTIKQAYQEPEDLHLVSGYTDDDDGVFLNRTKID